MEEQKLREKQISRMQNNLCALRKMAGWTTEQLAAKLDVSKQTISNLENKEDHTKMKYAQYVALKTIFDDEIKAKPKNELLKKAVEVLLNEPDPDEDQYKKVEVIMETLAAAKSAGKNDKELKSFLSIVTGITLANAIGVGVSMLIDEILNKTEKK